MAKRKTYAEILESIATPEGIPETITCRFCNEPMHLLRVNNMVAFWIHKGESIKKCGEANTMNPGHPFIAQNMTFYKNITEAWRELLDSKTKGAKMGMIVPYANTKQKEVKK